MTAAVNAPRIPTVEELGRAVGIYELTKKLEASARSSGKTRFADQLVKEIECQYRYLAHWAEILDADGNPVFP